MATPIILPMFNMDMEEGVLLRWLVAEGATVREGDPLCEIETDKVNMEVEAPGNGVLAGLQYAEGAHIPVTSVIAYLAKDAADAATVGSGAGTAAPGGEPAPVAAAGTGPTPAAATGAATPAAAPAPAAAAPAPAAAAAAASTAGAGGGQVDDPYLTGGRRRASPAVRRLAREHGIALADVADRHGRVTMDALRAAIAAGPAPAPVAPASAPAGAPATPAPAPATPAAPPAILAPTISTSLLTLPAATPAAAGPGDGERHPLEGTRRRIADRMVVAHQAPHITLVREARVPELMRLRAALAPAPPSVTALFAAATIRALQAHPAVNSTFEDGQVVSHRQVNLGIAVARPEGLIVPVLRDAQALSVMDLSARIRQLVDAARGGRLSMSDVSDGTFTITSLGEAGIDMFSPLVNPPQVAILGIGRITERVVPIENGIGVVPTVYLSLTCDHRVVDGAPGAEFLATLARDLESPTWLWSGAVGG